MNSTRASRPCGKARMASAIANRANTGQQAGFKQSPQTFSRGNVSRSSKSVRNPARAQNAAHDAPAGPLPTIATSYTSTGPT
jgi:hypothetical protein